MIPFAAYTAAETPNESLLVGWTTPKIAPLRGDLDPI